MNLEKYFSKKTSIIPLVIFRIAFGLIAGISAVRILLKGWIDPFYFDTTYHFKYLGFEWVKCPNEATMYILFILMAVFGLMISAGFFFRLAAVSYFFIFTYVELIDKTYYLNHYYLVSILAGLLMLTPANRFFSIDAKLNPSIESDKVSAWAINIIRIQLVIVYFYAGVAKLNYNWLVEAMPLKLWLPAKSHLPIIGPIFQYEWVAYLFSWGGAFYDLSIGFLLLHKKTRPYAFFAVVFFHLLTKALFPIGMFPYIMIASTLIFFEGDWLKKFMSIQRQVEAKLVFEHSIITRTRLIGLGIFFVIQIALPWRYLLYNNNLFWSEEGYRFSWRVMLMEKAGYADFYIVDTKTNKRTQVDLHDFLNPNQIKMMSAQPDMIQQFAHYLDGVYKDKGWTNIEVKANVQCTLNGARSKILVDPQVALNKTEISLKPKSWITKYHEGE